MFSAAIIAIIWPWMDGCVCRRIRLKTTLNDHMVFSFLPIIAQLDGRSHCIVHLHRFCGGCSEGHHQKWVGPRSDYIEHVVNDSAAEPSPLRWHVKVEAVVCYRCSIKERAHVVSLERCKHEIPPDRLCDCVCFGVSAHWLMLHLLLVDLWGFIISIE